MSTQVAMRPPSAADPSPAATRDSHTLTVEGAVAALQTHATAGLPAPEVEARRARHGASELDAASPDWAWRRFLARFQNLMIGVLLAAGVISAFAGHWIDSCVILAIVTLNGVIGFLQEERASRALA